MRNIAGTILVAVAGMAALACSIGSPATLSVGSTTSPAGAAFQPTALASDDSSRPSSTAPAPSASSSLNPFAGEVALSPLPAGTTMRLTQDEAIAIAVRQLPAADGANSVIYVAYGMGRAIYTDEADQLIWVVVVKANPSPHYGGPACDPTATCQPPLLVLDTAGAVVADRSGEVTRMFDQGHIASPAP